MSPSVGMRPMLRAAPGGEEASSKAGHVAICCTTSGIHPHGLWRLSAHGTMHGITHRITRRIVRANARDVPMAASPSLPGGIRCPHRRTRRRLASGT